MYVMYQPFSNAEYKIIILYIVLDEQEYERRSWIVEAPH
jgi:hypothetical protein